MSDAGKRAVDKLKIIKDMSPEGGVKQIAKTMIEYITEKEKPETAGFGKATTQDERK